MTKVLAAYSIENHSGSKSLGPIFETRRAAEKYFNRLVEERGEWLRTHYGIERLYYIPPTKKESYAH